MSKIVENSKKECDKIQACGEKKVLCKLLLRSINCGKRLISVASGRKPLVSFDLETDIIIFTRTSFGVNTIHEIDAFSVYSIHEIGHSM